MKIKFLLAFLAFSFFFCGSVFATDMNPYTEDSFRKAKSDGKSIVLVFHANWCPTCRAQKPVLESILKEKEFDGLVALQVDYDDSDDIQRELGVTRQSTVIVFKSGAEVGRSVSDTNKDSLTTLLKKGI